MLEKDLFLRGTISYIYIYIYIYMYASLQDKLGIGILESVCQTSPATDWNTEQEAGNQSYPSFDRSVYFGGLWFRALPTEPREISISQCIFIHCNFFYIWRFWMYITTYRLMILWLKSYCSWLLLNYIKSNRDMNGPKFTGPKIINCNYIHAAWKHKHILNCNYIHAARKHKRCFQIITCVENNT